MLRILLAEDQAPTARIMKLALEKNGYDVEVTHNGKEALAAIEREAPDALVTDIDMPVMTGQELCQKLEQSMPERSFPIYVITAVTDLVHRKWTRNIRDLYFLEKPVSVKRLAAELQKTLAS